ncbi:MAG: RSP_7527 family protein [Neptuniibacter sp.]
MNVEQDLSFRTTATGEVDTAYYVEQAAIMRADYVKSMMTSLKNVVVEILCFSFRERFGKAFSH